MKKKIFSLCLMFAFVLPCLILLSACGSKKVQSITVEDLFVGDVLAEYQYGTNINDIISIDNIKVVAYYDDGSTKVLNSNEYTIEFYKDSEKISNIKDILDVGYYSIRVSYDIVKKDSFFLDNS